MVLLLVLVRVLSAPEFGVYMLIIGLSEMMLVAASFGTLQIGRRYLPLMISSLPAGRLFRFVSALIAIQLAVLGVFSGALWLSWPAVAPMFGLGPGQGHSLHPAILLFLLVPAVKFSCELLDALLEQGKSRLIWSLTIYGRICGIGLLLALGPTVRLHEILIVDVIVLGACAVLAYLLLHRSLLALHNRGGTGEIPLREIVRFAGHMGPVDLMGAATSPGAIRLALANSLGVVESGLFAFLQSLQNLVGRYLPGTLLRGIVMPVLLTRAFSPGGRAVVEAGASLLIKGNLMIVAAGTVLIALCGDPLVALLSGGKFPEAGTTLLLMYLALAVMAQRGIIEMVMQITGQASTLRATAIISPLALAAVWALADHGLNVAILVIIAASALANGITTLILVRVSGGFRLEWRGQVEIVASAVAGVGLGVALESGGAGLAVSTAAALLAFAALLFVLRPFTRGEFAMVEKAMGARAARLTLRFLTKGPEPDDPDVRGTGQPEGGRSDEV